MPTVATPMHRTARWSSRPTSRGRQLIARRLRLQGVIEGRRRLAEQRVERRAGQPRSERRRRLRDGRKRRKRQQRQHPDRQRQFLRQVRASGAEAEQLLRLQRVGGKNHSDNDADADGGNTTATSGDATGGDGGNADADGGDADASNGALVKQTNESGGSSSHGDCGCKGPAIPPTRTGAAARSTRRTARVLRRATSRTSSRVTRRRMAVKPTPLVAMAAKPTPATPRSTTATPTRSPNRRRSSSTRASPAVAAPSGGKAHNDADADGGDTTATSGDATGGDGGNADADGGDAAAWNWAKVFQSNLSGVDSSPW